MKVVVIGAGISAIPVTRSELQVFPVNRSAISISGYLSTSDNIGTCSIESGVGKNVGVAVGISMIRLL